MSLVRTLPRLTFSLAVMMAGLLFVVAHDDEAVSAEYSIPSSSFCRFLVENQDLG
jgi:hypothetical protein